MDDPVCRCAECGHPIRPADKPGAWVHMNLDAWAQNPHDAIPLEDDR